MRNRGVAIFAFNGGGAVFAGYYQNPEANAKAFAHGWFHTGDMVRQAPDGMLYFVDRRKNIVRRSGENIAAVEVESVLLRHPAIQAAAVAPALPHAIVNIGSVSGLRPSPGSA